MAQIANLFSTTSETISDFFRRPGVGYYIPLYQREYSWDRENIDQQIAVDLFTAIGHSDTEKYAGQLAQVRGLSTV